MCRFSYTECRNNQFSRFRWNFFIFLFRLPIHFAAAGGSISIILIFQEIGVDYSVRDKFALTSIHYAAKYGQIQALKLLWTNGAASLDDKAYTLLVQSGVTPLHLGAESGFIDIVEFLLKNGCKIDFQTNEGLTPLHYAIKNGKSEMVKYLIEKGADPKITDLYGIFKFNILIKLALKLQLNLVILK